MKKIKRTKVTWENNDGSKEASYHWGYWSYWPNIRCVGYKYDNYPLSYIFLRFFLILAALGAVWYFLILNH